MKLVVLDAKTMGEIDFSPLKKFGELIIHDTTTKEQTIERIKDADIVLTNKVLLFEPELSSAKNLKLVCILATGMNNIDLEAAKRLDISVKNAKGYSTPSVVQTTFAILFYLSMGLDKYDEFTSTKAWSRSEIFTDMSRSFCELAGKSWGIIGLGEIGRSVAKVATAFGAKVSYYSTSGVNRDEIYPLESLKEIMEKDIISIHAPLNQKTDNLITKKELDMMKSGGIILNLGRGGIVNEKDLAEALESKNILAGLDVMSQEPPNEDNPLLNIKNKDRCFITPHIAWGSKESRERLLEITIENIERFLG
ncbi:MAG: D-2-hydroxyacid dehydrogenase [Campylobacterales bacterium]